VVNICLIRYLPPSLRINKTAAQDAQMKVSGIQNFMQANKDLAGQKTMKWSLDEYQPWQRKLKEITERIAASKVNQSNSIGTAIGSVVAAGTALSNNDLMKQLFAGGEQMTGASLMPSMIANPQLIPNVIPQAQAGGGGL